MNAAAPRRQPVFVVVPPRALLLDIAGPVEALRGANRAQDAVRFDVVWVGPRADVTSSIGVRLSGLAPLPPQLPDGAMVLVSGNVGEVAFADPDTRDDAAQEAAIVAWLRHAIRPGMRLLSICSGALLAARAGLLDGVDCTTHHSCTDELARIAPAARVVDNRLYVDAGERCTSAGVTAGMDLMLHVLAQEAGTACAVAVARHLVLYLRRAGNEPQVSHWLDGRNHLHPAVHRVQDAISQAPTQAWPLERLAHVAGTSARHLSRLFNEHAGMGVPDYVNRLRVAVARELLGQTRLDMERVAERAGFASSRQLRRAWARVHGGSPQTMREGLR